MGKLRRLVLLRHGETNGESSVRFHGSGDVDLSPEGRAEMRRAAARIVPMPELVVASPLRRSWRSARIAGDGRRVLLVNEFREIHFGRWEGLTLAEIEARDPILFKEWQSRAAGFEYPGGEPRGDFKARVAQGLGRLLAADANDALVVVHKGVIRQIVESLTGTAIPSDQPALGEILVVTRTPDATWFLGQRSSNPPGLEDAA
jgi:broad specificity phosphatase PhoE